MRIEGGLRSRGIVKQMRPGIPLISVITVVFNGAEHLEEAMLSVLGQDYADLEYIIIDGGSTDGSLDIIKRYEDRIDYWVSEPDRGIYDAMNKGIAAARGELIGLLNADDRYEPGALKVVAAASADNPGAGIFYGNSYILQEDMGMRYKSYGSARFWRGMGFPHQAMFVRRAVHNAIGTYDTNYRIAADYDLLLRAMANGILFSHLDAFLVSYRNTGLSGSNLYATLNETRKVGRKHFGLLSLAHAGFLLLFSKSCLLMALQRLIRLVCGERTLSRVRASYTKRVIAKEHELI